MFPYKLFVALTDSLLDGFKDPVLYEVWLEIQDDLLNVSVVMFNYEDKDECFSAAYKLLYEAITTDEELDESNAVEELAIKLITSLDIKQFIKHYTLMQVFDCLYEDGMSLEDATVAVEEWYDEEPTNRLFYDLEGNELWLHPDGTINGKKPKHLKKKRK